MTMWRMAPAVLFGVAFLGCGNGNSGSAPAGSGAPAAGGSGAPQAAAGGKLVHHKLTKNECTFEFDASEQLKPAEKDDGLSVTVQSATFEFAGFSGASLYGLDQLSGLALMGSKDDTVLVKETANNLDLIVTRSAKPPSNPVKFISGMGEEANVKDRQLGCSYLCSGTKEKEAETVAMCKSVKITFTPEKK